MSLTAEQCRALAMLTSAGLDGASQTLLMAHGFCVSMIVGLVNNGLATLTREKVWAGNRLIEVGKVRITAAGRKALITEGRRCTQPALPPTPLRAEVPARRRPEGSDAHQRRNPQLGATRGTCARP
jgi:hypothetical protein